MTQEHLSNKSASDEDSGIPSAQALPEAEQAARRETAVVSDANGTVVPGDENTVNAAAQAATMLRLMTIGIVVSLVCGMPFVGP